MKRFSIYSLPPHMHSLPHYQHPRLTGYLLQLMNQLNHIIITQSPQFILGFTLGVCLSPFWQLQNTIDWGLTNNRNLFHSSGGSEVQDQGTGRLSPGESLLSHRRPSSPCAFTWLRGEGAPRDLFYKGINPIHRSSTIMI